jgi:hypothetical protein
MIVPMMSRGSRTGMVIPISWICLTSGQLRTGCPTLFAFGRSGFGGRRHRGCGSCDLPCR